MLLIMFNRLSLLITKMHRVPSVPALKANLYWQFFLLQAIDVFFFCFDSDWQSFVTCCLIYFIFITMSCFVSKLLIVSEYLFPSINCHAGFLWYNIYWCVVNKVVTCFLVFPCRLNFSLQVWCRLHCVRLRSREHYYYGMF